MSKNTSTSHNLGPIVGAAATVLAIIGAVALVALDIHAEARGRTIESVPQPPLTRVLVCAGLLIIAIAWATWLAKHYGLKHILTIIASVIAVILLIATPVLGWQAMNHQRDLTVISMTCDAEILTNSGVAPLTECQEESVDTIVLLEGVESEDTWVPDASTNNLTREFDDLPGGKWKTRLTVDGPADAVSVAAVADRDGKQERIGNLQPSMDAESGRLRWSGVVPVESDVSQIRVLFYLSPNPAVESASIRFDVRQCSGQSVRNFDASQCEPFEGSSSFVVEKKPDSARTWRQPLVTREGTTLVVTNLEARTYVLEPDYTSIQAYTQSTDVLIIPTAMEQVEANSITVPGESSFEVTVEPNTGELTYVIYVFPTGPTYASVGS